MTWTLKDSTSISDSIKWMLNDRAASDNLASWDRLKNLIHQHAISILERIGYQVKNKSVALTVGVSDYVLTAGTMTPALYSVVTDKNWPLQRCSWGEMLQLNFLSAVSSGDPILYATYENDSGEMAIRLWPTPNRAGSNLTCFYSQYPDSVNSAVTGDGFNLEIAPSVGYVIARSVAVEVLSFASQDMLQTRGLSKDVIPLWTQMVDTGIREERIRKNRMSRTGNVELGRRD